jgi:hypothetical protein
MIIIDLEKAKPIAKDILRTERAPVLASLDVQFQRALETNANTSSIVAKKQELRDITNHTSIVNAETAEDLKTALDTLVSQIKAE